MTLLAVPSDAPGGFDADISGHFGHCDAFSLFRIDNGTVVETAVLPALLPLDQLPSASSLNMTVMSAGAIAGPLIGGALLGHFWWGSVFLVNVPVMLIVLPPISLLPIFPAFWLFDKIDDWLSTWSDISYLWYLPLLTWPTAIGLITVTVFLICALRWAIRV